MSTYRDLKAGDVFFCDGGIFLVVSRRTADERFKDAVVFDMLDLLSGEVLDNLAYEADSRHRWRLLEEG
jgi:hypothetical protein